METFSFKTKDDFRVDVDASTPISAYNKLMSIPSIRIVLTSLNTKRLAELLDQFVQDHNENTMKIAQEIEESSTKQEEE